MNENDRMREIEWVRANVRNPWLVLSPGDEALLHTADMLDALSAELRWCDAERRLALRALAKYAPKCHSCTRLGTRILDGHKRTMGGSRARYCDECSVPTERDVRDAAQIAAADEEAGQ